MKQDKSGPAGDKPRVRRVSSAHAPQQYVVGEMNLGGMPCEVIYRGPEAQAAARPAALRVDPAGRVTWTPQSEPPMRDDPRAEPTATEAPRALARRPGSRWDEPRLGMLERQLPPEEPLAEAAQGTGDLAKIHRLLRGRYLLAMLLSLALGGAGIWAGLHFGHKTYQSTGLITITPIHLFPGSDGNQSNEQFMQAQVAKFRSQGVTDAALDDPAWQALGRNRSDAVEAAFAKELEVTQQGQTMLIKFTDPDPQAAKIAVQTAMSAFRKRFDVEQAQSEDFAQGQWMAARVDLNAKLTRIQQQMDDVAGIYGPAGVVMRRDIKLQELQEVEKGITGLEQAQVLATPLKKAAAPAVTPTGEVPVEEIARVDALMTNLLGRRAQLQEQIAEMRTSGALPGLPKLKNAAAMLSMVEQEISTRAADWRITHPRSLKTSAPELPGTTQELSPEAMKARSEYLKGRKRALEQDLSALSGQIGSIEKRRIEKDRIQKDLSLAEEELQQDEIQKTNWRIDVSEADRPLTAFRDTRITFSGAGGLGGVVIGFGLMLLFGLLDRRVRDPRDAAGQFAGAPILGMLPQLPDDLADPEQAAAAAHGVHEIRTLLQIWGRGQEHQVFGITSSAAATGKTSLTLALGVSFASASFKTLLIDCDLVGGGLSARIDSLIRRKIGKILTRDGYVTEPQLRQALALAGGSGRKLGEILIGLGYLTQDDLGMAMAAQADEPVGLLDALAGEPLEDCVAETGIPGLWVLPLGAATAHHAATLSPDSLHRIIEIARDRFDIVLVDTGPVPGSLEASITASQVDAVVVTVARGDRGPNVQRSINHLRSLGTRLAGIVFNRARQHDIEHYGSSRLSSAGGSGGDMEMRMLDTPESARLGPVARAVASFAPRD